jgi:hypothetical protein
MYLRIKRDQVSSPGPRERFGSALVMSGRSDASAVAFRCSVVLFGECVSFVLYSLSNRSLERQDGDIRVMCTVILRGFN